MKSAVFPENEVERIRKLDELGILDTLEEQAYDDLTTLAAQICDTPIALVSLVDRDRQWFKSHYGLDARETPREVAFCSHAILQDDVFVIEDSGQDERFFDNPLVTGAPYVKFYAGVPLVMSDNLKLGTLCVIANEARTLSASQQQSLKALARQVVSQLELRLKIKKLESLDNAKDEFISMVSHELRTPLTSVTGSLSLLFNNKVGQLDEKQHSLVGIAVRNSDRLLSLVNDILDLAKLEAGKFEIDRQPYNIVTLLNKAVELNEPFCTQCHCGLTVQYTCPDETVLVLADEHRLLQVLSNLISNAAKFSYEQGNVELSMLCEADKVRITITDHGPGIPAEQQSELFQTFKQIGSSATQKMPGTGLGLKISKQIIELHEGEIKVESCPDEATSFYFTLPRVKTA
ncbi:MAG: GAF domain-containing sensor histidine kinase [Pontibacterium sp.]